MRVYIFVCVHTHFVRKYLIGEWAKSRQKEPENTWGRKKNCRYKKEVRKTEAEKITKKELEKEWVWRMRS